jgi:ADP-heptose:LPS heptosyltransferase
MSLPRRMNHQILIEEVGRLWWSYATAGHLERAWEQSDRLLRAGIDFSHLSRFFRPLWDGRPVFHANVWLRCWRGLGDAIHFIRYAKPLRARCAHLVVEAPDELHRLFANLAEIDELTGIDEHRRVGEEFVEIESTELPHVLRTTLVTIPNSVPYLQAEPDSRVPKDTTPNVGLCWQGSNYDSRRQLALAELAPLQSASGIRFWQLQRGPALAQAAGSGFKFENPVDESIDVATTADLIAALDLVITIDSMVAHLAGALGKPVWTLLHAAPDWRWFRDRSDSPWYPTMRLYRQTVPGDWAGVVPRVAADLRSIANGK